MENRAKIVILAGLSVLSGFGMVEAMDSVPMRSIADSIAVKSEGRIEINCPEALKPRLMRDSASTHSHSSHVREPQHGGTMIVYKSGYRVQVYSDSKPRYAKVRCQDLAARISAEFPGTGTYIAYKAPYWRLKAGDFESRSHAVHFMGELRSKYPSLAGEMIIVRDRIKVIE